MILRIEATLCEPPSSISVFRDTTLYSTIFAKLDCVLQCQLGTRSTYWNWLKRYGAHDFIKAVILPEEEPTAYLLGTKNANIRVDKLNETTLPFVISAIRGIRQG